MMDSPRIFSAPPRLTTALVLISVLVLFTATLGPFTIPFHQSVLDVVHSSKSANYKIETDTTRLAIPVPTNPADGKLHIPNGKHYMLDFRDVDHTGLTFLDTAGGQSFLSQEITRSGMTVLGSQSHRFAGGGLSLVFLLAESHMSVHSWPEHSFVAIDIYTCGDSTAAERLVDSMHALLKPDTAKVSYIERGANLTHSSQIKLGNMINVTSGGKIGPLFDADRSHPIILPAKVDICVNADFGGDDCFLWRGASLLFSERSDVQLVEVVERRSGQRCLLLDGAVQFCNSSDNDLYTRSLTDAVMHPLLERNGDVDVYVIGGGDGWIGNHLITAYPSVIRSIGVIDIDPLVSYATQKFFPAKGHSSFQDARVTYITADAASWLRNAANESADAVIIDCTDHTVESASVLYTKSFYSDVLRVLRPGGRFSQQMNIKNEYHESFQYEVKKSWEIVGFIDTMEWYEHIPSYGGNIVMMGGIKDSKD